MLVMKSMQKCAYLVGAMGKVNHPLLACSCSYSQVSTWRHAADQAASVAEAAQGRAEVLNAKLEEAAATLAARSAELEAHRMELAAAKLAADEAKALLAKR